MKPNDLVEFQTAAGSFGTGRVVEYDEETEVVTVRDVDDGSLWRGPEEMTSPAGGQAEES
jgi:hypothetical protein